MSTISTAKIYLQTRPNCACNGGSTCRACLSASLLVICPPPTIDVFLSPYAASPRSGEFMDRRALLVHITHVAQSRFVLTVIHSYTTSIAYSPPPLFVQTYARNETFDRNKRKKEKSNRAAGEVRYARLIGSTFQKGKGSKKSEESIEKKEKEKEEKEEGKHRNNNNPVLQAEEVKITKKKKNPPSLFFFSPPLPPLRREEKRRERKRLKLHVFYSFPQLETRCPFAAHRTHTAMLAFSFMSNPDISCVFEFSLSTVMTTVDANFPSRLGPLTSQMGAP